MKKIIQRIIETIMEQMKSLLIYAISGVFISLIIIAICYFGGYDQRSILKYAAIVVIVIGAAGAMGGSKMSKDYEYIRNRGMYQNEVDGVIEDQERATKNIYRAIKMFLTSAIIYGISLI
ncbi:hypothetical protein [Clostridium sp. UBA4548]|uniref:hypothetical protein n=1 Tax=Clostridium sp. UBA4548 TaxID=1946361 RepID=UPI0025B969FE|nr:hypothetical protein [Clostridium sp. UBA4548]